MATLLQDLSRLGPAPTLRRESAVLAVSVVFVVLLFGALIAISDRSPTLYLVIAGALLAIQLGRWMYAASRGDVDR